MNKPLARKDNIVIQKLKGETLIYDLKENRAFCLNETSTLVWELCNGTRTVAEISAELRRRLKAQVSSEIADLAIHQLSNDNLLEDGAADYFSGVSRREAIRKVGFASVITLPMISSLVAPNALNAQSGGTPSPPVCNPFLSACGPCCPGTTCVSGRCCQPGAGGNASPMTLVISGLAGECLSSAECATEAQAQCCSGTATRSFDVACVTNPFANSTSACSCS